MLDYLSDKETAELQKFLANGVMCEAVRKVLMSGIYFDGVLTPDKPADPQRNFILAAMTTRNPNGQVMTMQEKGLKIEAIINAVSILESAFSEMNKVRPVESPLQGKTTNPAR